MITRFAILATAVAGMASLTAACAAQDFKSLRDSCREDYKRLCASVQPGGGRAKQCLTDNLDKLAPACKAAVSGTLLKSTN